MARLVWCGCAWFEAVRALGVNVESESGIYQCFLLKCSIMYRLSIPNQQVIDDSFLFCL